MTRICPECQEENLDGQIYCRNCGVNLTSRKNDAEEPRNQWVTMLFCWKTQDSYRLAKSKVIFWVAFIITFCSFQNYYFSINSVNASSVAGGAFAGIIAGLIVAVPVYAWALIIHYVIERYGQ